MTPAEADELRALQRRAYGPTADIHVDPAALERLRELEGQRRELQPESVSEGDDEQLDSARSADAEPAPPEEPQPDPEPTESEPADAGAPPTRRRVRPRMRRSTALIAIGLVAILLLTYASVVLVQRVQTDPLQAGAAQVARLAADPSYDVPPLFSGGDPTQSAPQAYQEFYGLRPVVSDSLGNRASNDECILVFPADAVSESEERAFTGPAFGGCGAGAFPASVTFGVTSELPDELLDAFPHGSALQFVVDERNNEVVVFSDR